MPNEPYRIKTGLVVEGEVLADNFPPPSPSLEDLADVDTSSTPPSDGQTLNYNAAQSKWIPSSLAGPPGATGPAGEPGATGPVGPQGQSTSYYEYQINTGVIVGDPTSGKIIYDSAVQTDATQLNISHLTSNLVDIDIFLTLLGSLDVIILQDSSDHDSYQKWLLSGPVTVEVGYVTVQVELIDSSGSGTTGFSNNQSVILAIVGGGIIGPTGPTGPVGATGPGGSLTSGVLNHTTASLAAGAFENFAIAGGDVFHLLEVTASTPAWVRVYGTTAARAADARTDPGGTPPGAGNDFYAELATVATPQTIRFSPVPLVQGTSGDAFIRVKNMDTVSRAITLNFSVLTLEA